MDTDRIKEEGCSSKANLVTGTSTLHVLFFLLNAEAQNLMRHISSLSNYF